MGNFRICILLSVVLAILLMVEYGQCKSSYNLKRRTRYKKSPQDKEPDYNDQGFSTDRESEWEEEDTPTEGKVDAINCEEGEWDNLAFEESVRFSLEEESCEINVLGSKAEQCSAEIVCTDLNFEEPVNGVCKPDSQMEVADSLGGTMTVCGKSKFGGPYRASHNGRDLYITYKGKSPGTICQVICGQDRTVQKFEPLEINGGRKIEESCVCGVKPKKRSRVVGGVNAEAFEFPWIAAVSLKGARNQFCGGSLINDRYILSAAHCFASGIDVLPTEVDILLHAHILDLNINSHYKPGAKAGQKGSIADVPGLHLKNFTDEEEHTLRLEVEEIYVHPLWSADTLDYDAALLKLKHPINLKKSSSIGTVCLPPEGKLFNYGGKRAIVAGWGKLHENAGAASRILQKLEMPVIKAINCRRILTRAMTPRMLCAGFLEGGRDSCGDSGGPLVYKFNVKNQYRLIGLVSWGSGCARPASPGVYTNVQEIIQWIYHFTQDATWCKEKLEVSYETYKPQGLLSAVKKSVKHILGSVLG